jgi:hypothetical protein
MLFIFKQKPIILDCFTSNSAAHDYAEISPAINHIPKWWKQIPSSSINLRTMKSCTGFIELYNKGIVIPLWSDLLLSTTPDDISWKFADGTSVIQPHLKQQAGEFFTLADRLHIKIETPWMFKCKEDIPWHFSQPVWNDLAAKNYCTPSGIIEFKYQHSTNVNMLLPSIKRELMIPHTHPIAHIIPLSERPVKINCHLVSKEEYSRLFSIPTFVNTYYKTKKIMEEKESKSKCPFGFGK